jgi:hypothetical protein
MGLHGNPGVREVVRFRTAYKAAVAAASCAGVGRQLRERAAPPWPPFALRMPGAGFLHILPGFPVPEGSWQRRRVFFFQLVTVAAFRRGPRLLAEMRTGTMCLHLSYPDSIRTRARRFLRCIPSQVCFEPLTRIQVAATGWMQGSSRWDTPAPRRSTWTRSGCPTTSTSNLKWHFCCFHSALARPSESSPYVVTREGVLPVLNVIARPKK